MKRRDGTECNTTCQICARPILAKTGKIAHHGYTRPIYRSGWQTASCYGARKLPYEVDRSVLREYLDRFMHPALDRTNALLKAVRAGGPDLEVPNPAYARYLDRIAYYKYRGKPPQGEPPPQMLKFVERPPEINGRYDFDNPQWAAAREYERALESFTYQVEREQQAIEEDVERLEARYDAWVAPA
jgi:hypothetical protein